MRFTCPLGLCPIEEYVPVAVAAEEAGFDAVTCGDSFMYPRESSGTYPYTDDGDRSFIEKFPAVAPEVVMSLWAAATKHITFYTSVYKFPSREPVQVTKMMTSLAVMSGERLKFGIGLSPWEEDFTVFGLRFQDRAKRLEEGVEIMRGLMTGDFFSYEGKHFRFPDIKLNPVPEKPIPILLCGHAEPAMRRAARIGDGWIPHAISSAQAREMIATIRRYRADYGRGAEPFSAVVPLLDAFEPDGYRRAEEFGVTHILTTPWVLYGGSHRSLADKRDGLRRFADEVIAKMG